MKTLKTKSLSGSQNSAEHAACCTILTLIATKQTQCVDVHMFIETVFTCFDVLTLSCAQTFSNVISKLYNHRKTLSRGVMLGVIFGMTFAEDTGKDQHLRLAHMKALVNCQ